jgi:outer membrane lipoprotein LolB
MKGLGRDLDRALRSAASGSLLLLMLTAVALLAGCQVAPVKAPAPQGPGTLADHVAAVRQLTGWSVSGRAAISTPEQAGTVSIDWRQDDERYAIELRAPLGAGIVRLEGSDAGVMLRTSQGVQEFASEPRELLRRHTAFDLPVEALRYWLLGIPQPDVPEEPAVDERGLLTTLRQQGWLIQYLRYGEFDGIALPTKLFMRGDGIEARIVVQQWTVSR